jgi:hypothetical protein
MEVMPKVLQMSNLKGGNGSYLRFGRFITKENRRLSTEYKAGWIPGLVWNWRGENLSNPAISLLHYNTDSVALRYPIVDIGYG